MSSKRSTFSPQPYCSQLNTLSRNININIKYLFACSKSGDLKSNFNDYTYIGSSCIRWESNCRNTFSPSLFNSHHYRWCCLYFYRLYYYYFFSALSLSLSPLRLAVVVLAATTTRFSFLFFLLLVLYPSFFSICASIISYQQTHCSTSWLFQRGLRWWTNISRHCMERERERRLLQHSLPAHNGPIVLMLSFFVIILLQAPGLFPFPHSISSSPLCYFKLDISRQFSSVDRIITDVKYCINAYE
jgi:hypothetical protein